MDKTYLDRLEEELQKYVKEFLKQHTELKEFSVSEKEKVEELKEELLEEIADIIADRIRELINYNGDLEFFLEVGYNYYTEDVKILLYTFDIKFSDDEEADISIELFEEKRILDKIIIPVLKNDS